MLWWRGHSAILGVIATPAGATAELQSQRGRGALCYGRAAGLCTADETGCRLLLGWRFCSTVWHGASLGQWLHAGHLAMSTAMLCMACAVRCTPGDLTSEVGAGAKPAPQQLPGLAAGGSRACTLPH